jgi:hypothetical protein
MKCSIRKPPPQNSLPGGSPEAANPVPGTKPREELARYTAALSCILPNTVSAYRLGCRTQTANRQRSGNSPGLKLRREFPAVAWRDTTFNAPRHSGALPGDFVAVMGIGGRGHLGIRIGNEFGYRVAAIGRGSGNAAPAKRLGASLYTDSKSASAAEAFQKLGGTQVIPATAQAPGR